MKTADFDFDLPPDRIAEHPVRPRDAARLLEVGPTSCDQPLRDFIVRDLPTLLQPGDLMVVNDTRVIPARLDGRRGEVAVEITLHKRLGEREWTTFSKPGKRLKPGDTIVIADGFSAEVIAKDGMEVRLRFSAGGAELMEALHRHGRMPLPPTMNVIEDPFNRPFDNFVALADAIGEALQCPVTIENANHQLIAYSSHAASADPARTTTIISRRVPEPVISSLWKNGVLRQLMDSDKPVRVSGISGVGLGNRVAVSIRHQNDVLGYIWALEEEKPLDPEGEKLLQRAAQASKALMLQLQMHKRKEEEGRQNFFWQMLTGHGQSAEWLRRKEAELQLTLPSAFQVIVFALGADIAPNMYRQMQYAASSAKQVHIALQARDERHYILLVSPLASTADSNASGILIQTFTEQMKERFDVRVEGACGQLYGDYAQVEHSYREALELLVMKRKFPEQLSGSVQYGELGYYRYLPQMARQPRSPYESGVVGRLRQYDREHNTTLLHTLQLFLELDSDVKRTSDKLHIHANTMNYRLKRIAEIGGIDLGNMDHKVTVFLELKLERLLN